MAQADRDESVVDAGKQLGVKDKIVICLVVFFSAIALTFELYWLIFNQAMESRSDLMARAFALYWPADSTYRVPGRSVAKSFTLALEGVNTFITPCLSFVLVWGILKRRPFRHALQLIIATYSLYSVLLYYLVAHISGYATFLLLYLVTAPWFVGYAWMGWDAFQALAWPARASVRSLYSVAPDFGHLPL
jgi:hypothetical protein